jgi:drug/metabolite transporter (DMT)-like permease
MNPLANIWNHPRTSAAGLLIGVASIGSVLAQQGITLGKAGTGSVVSLATGIATVLLGLLAKDPSPQPATAKSADRQAGMTAG